jgi:hypothetical protein
MLFLCPICAGEFEVTLASCPGCGVDLVPGTIEYKAMDNVTPITRDVEFEELCRPDGYPLAMLIKDTLEQNGVTAIVQGGHSISVFPSLSFLGEMRVLVDKTQLEYARQLYEAYFEGDGAELDEGE